MTRRSSAAPVAGPTIPKIPPTEVLGRLAALHAAPIATLKRQWLELYGKDWAVAGQRRRLQAAEQ